jgi:hypothetical protein
MSPEVAHRVISLRCGIWSLSGHSGLWQAVRGRFIISRLDCSNAASADGWLGRLGGADDALGRLPLASDRPGGFLHVIGMVMTVGVDQNLHRHAKESGCLPRVSAQLHKPGRRRVSQRVRGDVAFRQIELRHLHGTCERVLDRLHARALLFDEVVGDDLLVVPAPHVDQQTVRQRHGGLTLVRSAPADRQTVIEAAQEARDSLPATNASSPAAGSVGKPGKISGS